jgi:hypothetical protein
MSEVNADTVANLGLATTIMLGGAALVTAITGWWLAGAGTCVILILPCLYLAERVLPRITEPILDRILGRRK